MCSQDQYDLLAEQINNLKEMYFGPIAICTSTVPDKESTVAYIAHRLIHIQNYPSVEESSSLLQGSNAIALFEESLSLYKLKLLITHNVTWIVSEDDVSQPELEKELPLHLTINNTKYRMINISVDIEMMLNVMDVMDYNLPSNNQPIFYYKEYRGFIGIYIQVGIPIKVERMMNVVFTNAIELYHLDSMSDIYYHTDINEYKYYLLTLRSTNGILPTNEKILVAFNVVLDNVVISEMMVQFTLKSFKYQPLPDNDGLEEVNFEIEYSLDKFYLEVDDNFSVSIDGSTENTSTLESFVCTSNYVAKLLDKGYPVYTIKPKGEQDESMPPMPFPVSGNNSISNC